MKNIKRIITIFVIAILALLVFVNVPDVKANSILSTYLEVVVNRPSDDSIWVIYNDSTNVVVTQSKIEDASGVGYDYTNNKIVFATNGDEIMAYDLTSEEFPSVKTTLNFTRDKVDGYEMHLTGWRLKAVMQNGSVIDQFVAPVDNDYSDVTNAQKDIGTVYAQEGFYVVPLGVSAIVVEPVFGKAIYVRSPYDEMFYDEFHIFIYGKNSDGKYSSDYYKNKLLYTGDAPADADLAVAKSSDDNTGRSPIHSADDTNGPVSTLRRAYQLVTASSSNTVYDYLFVLCGNLYEVNRVKDGETYAQASPAGSIYNYYSGYFGYLSVGTKPVTITSVKDKNYKLDEMKDKYNFYPKPTSYDFTNVSNLRLDNLNIACLSIDNVEAIHNAGKKNNTYARTRQFNFDDNHFFETTETVTSSESSQIRLKKGKYFKFLGGQWNPIYAYSASNTTLNNNNYIHIGGKAYCPYVSNNSCAINNPEISMVVNNPPDIIVTGGQIGVVTKKSTSNDGIYGSGVVVNSNVGGIVNIFVSDGRISNLYGAGYGSVVENANGECGVNIKVTGGKINYIYGAGQYYTSVINGDINLSLESLTDNTITVTGNVYGGGKGGKVNGNVNLSMKKVNVTTNSFDSATGKVFGGGFGLIDNITYTNAVESSVKLDFSVEEAITKFNNSTKGNRTVLWEEAPKGFPVYNKETDEIIARIYHQISKANGAWYLYEKVQKIALTLAEIKGNVNLDIDESNIAVDVYGGGSISQVLGNVDVNISDSTIGGILYGGGDGVTKLSTVTLYKPITDDYEVIKTDKSDPAKSLGAFSLSDDIDILTHFDGIYDGYNKNLYDPITGHPKSFSTGLTAEQQALVQKYGTKRLIYGSINQKDLGYISGNVSLTLTNNKVSTVYGGGNQGYIGGSTQLTINSTNGEIVAAYAGSNKADVGGSTLILNGGVIETAFGGGNQGDVLGNITVITSGNSLEVSNLYAASNQANVGGNVSLTINGGTFTYVFGGNNLSGNISGDIEVNINNGTISALYGGGNQAIFNNKATINFFNGSIILDNSIADNAIFGGGKEAYAKESSIIIHNGTIASSVYGGGYVGDVDSASVAIYGSTIDGTVFGGGLNGDVKTTQVIISESTDADSNPIIPIIEGTVYGGGQDGMVTGSTQVSINGGSFSGDIYGGGKGQTATTLATGVSITGAIINGTVYGGGNLGVVTSNIEVEITDSQITKVYGGGDLAEVNGKTTVIIAGSSTIDDGLFGGGNLADVKDTEIIINDGIYNSAVYGGGNQGQVDGNTIITINNGNFKTNVYGGGFQGNVANKVTFDIFGGSFSKNIYGGGYAGTVSEVLMNIIDYDSEGNVTPINITDSVFAGGEGLTATVLKTKLTVDFKMSSTVKEELESEAVDSSAGQAKITFDPEQNITTQSKILGSVYGGGDLAKVGDGTINMSNHEATFIAEGSTEVFILNAYIGDSVFAGGRGVAPAGMSYSVYMGTVFGMTEITVNSGYIGGSVYGGGRESRVYAKNDTASVVNLIQEEEATDGVSNSYNLIIGSSVFGGGDRGTGEATNASVPTTIGDVYVNITGCDEGTAMYFLDGGVYGDGNLCLVNGDKEVNMTNFTTGENGKLKTFYSLQRADVVNLENTDIVLLGAIDKVEEGDDTRYSINRITTLNLANGSTVKLSTIVKYLGTIYSDYETADQSITPDRIFINKGYNGTNFYNADKVSKPDALTDSEVLVYRQLYETSTGGTTNNPQNTVSVANGLYLELKNVDGSYGKVVGLFTLQLFIPTPGEGGGLVYADILDCTGDFICVTKFADDGNDETIETYMDVLDDVCRLTENGYTAYYWYIAGTRINYNISLTGYIGSEQPSYTESVTIPRFPNTAVYLLTEVKLDENSDFIKALTKDSEGKSAYNLVTNTDDLTENNIAIEVRYGVNIGNSTKNTLGFLYYNSEADKWGLCRPLGDICYGYNNEVDSESNLIAAMDRNTIYSTNGTEQDTGLDIILHKSPEVNVEYNNLNFSFQINLFIYENEAYTPLQNQTNELFFACNLAIRRLVPIQSSYASVGHLYSGVLTNMDLMGITSNSSITMQIQTRYIPGAFPQTGTASMSWVIKAETYNYYFDSGTSSFLVTDINDKVINYSDNLAGSFEDDGSIKPTNPAGLTKSGDNYIYKYGIEEEIRTLNIVSYASYSPFPIGTTITLIDISETEFTSIYYYIVTEEDTVEVDLLNFMQMGSNIKIKDLKNKPYFMDLYTDSSKANVRITEDLIFIFDFTNVVNNSEKCDFIWNSKSNELSDYDQFSGTISLAHMYQGKDIMDYVKTPETEFDAALKEYPRYSDFVISKEESGIKEYEAEFIAEEYYSNDEYVLDITTMTDDYWHNTEYEERNFSTVIELVDLNVNSVELPEGMSFKYKQNIYYSKDGGKTVIVPFGEAGTHRITIDNYMYGLYEYLIALEKQGYKFKDGSGNYIVTFAIKAYSSVYGDYYNEMLVNVDSIYLSFIVLPNIEEAISVTTSDNVVKTNEEIKLNIETNQDNDLTIEVYKKSNGLYKENVTNKFMPMGNSYALVNGQSNEIIITVSNEIETGTYQFIATIGKYREIITVIVVNESSANSN